MTAPIPLNPDGTPKLGPGSGVIVTGGNIDASGSLSIWNLPSGLDKQNIWFDVGHKKVTTTRLAGSGRLSPDFGVDANGKQGKPVSTTSISSSEIVKSPDQIMKQFAALSANDPGSFVAFQKLLASGPWGKVYASGAFDPATEKALGVAMLQYVKLAKGAGVGMSFTDYLQQTAARNQALGGDGTSVGAGGGSKAAQVLAVSDPTSIRAAAQSAAQQALGMGLSEKQLDKFVAQFQAAQTSAQSATSGTVTSPDLSGDAMQFAQQENPAAYQANQHDSYLSALVNLFAPAGSQRPNMTPTPKA